MLTLRRRVWRPRLAQGCLLYERSVLQLSFDFVQISGVEVMRGIMV